MSTHSNITYDELQIGSYASLIRTLTKRDIIDFACATQDINPVHLCNEFAAQTRFGKIIGHGMWTGAMLSALLGCQLPGPGTIYLTQTLKFFHPVFLGDTITATVRVISKNNSGKRVTLETYCVNQSGTLVVSGEALVIAPSEKFCAVSLSVDLLEIT